MVGRPAGGVSDPALGRRQPGPLRWDGLSRLVTPESGATRSASSIASKAPVGSPCACRIHARVTRPVASGWVWFALLPIPPRRLATGLLAAAFVGVAPAVTLIAFAALPVTAARLGVLRSWWRCPRCCWSCWWWCCCQEWWSRP
jgi:hypothetical protein